MDDEVQGAVEEETGPAAVRRVPPGLLGALPVHMPFFSRAEKARMHAASRVHHTPMSNVAFRLVCSSFEIGLSVSCPSPLVLAAAFAPPPPPPPPGPLPNISFPRRTPLLLEDAGPYVVAPGGAYRRSETAWELMTERGKKSPTPLSRPF